jgi:hypothetical protein
MPVPPLSSFAQSGRGERGDFFAPKIRCVQLERDRIRRSLHFFLDFISEAPYI